MTTPDGKFEFSYIRSPKQFAGKMTPFRRTWWVQYLGDGTSAWPDNRRGVFEFVRSSTRYATHRAPSGS